MLKNCLVNFKLWTVSPESANNDTALIHTESTPTLTLFTAQYLFNNIQINFSTSQTVSYIYLAFTFVHCLFTRFKISLSLHLYNINSTVLSHGPAASSEAFRFDSWLIIRLDFTNRLMSLSRRAANWQKGSNMHQKSQCGLLYVRAVRWRMDGPLSSPTGEVLRSVAPQRV